MRFLLLNDALMRVLVLNDTFVILFDVNDALMIFFVGIQYLNEIFYFKEIMRLSHSGSFTVIPPH